jgi:hypothetical protein
MKNTKPKIEVTWPETPSFTVQSLWEENPKIINITLRFKIQQEIENGNIVEVGKNPTTMGRPTKVFTKSNPSNKTLLELKKDGVILNEKYDSKVTKTTAVVAEFNNEQVTTTEKTEEEVTQVPTRVSETVSV